MKQKKNQYTTSALIKNDEPNMSGPVGPAVGKTCGPDSKKVGLGPAGLL